MKESKLHVYSFSIPNVLRNNYSNIKISLFNNLRIYINNIFFISISFLFIIIISKNNNSLRIPGFFIGYLLMLETTPIKNHEFMRLLFCKQPLLQPINISYVDFWLSLQSEHFYFQRLFEKVIELILLIIFLITRFVI